MKKVTIFGERCSGTNYLEQLIRQNFEVTITWKYGHKHFFGFQDLSESHDVLFIGIIRNLPDWINSLYQNPWHLPKEVTESVDLFLTNPIYSYDNNNLEIMTDRHIETHERYKNIFELRCIKNRFLIEKMPTFVKNYCLITYDGLVHDFIETMYKLKNTGLSIKKNIEFPLNITYYKDHKNKRYTKKEYNWISNEKIKECIRENKELQYYESLLFPNHNIVCP